MSSQRDRHGRPGHEKQPTFWDYNQRGVLFCSRGQYPLAIAELRRAVRASAIPLAVLYVNLGAAYLRSGMYGQARASLVEGLRANPDDQTGHVLLGQALLATGEPGTARREFELAWQLNPESLEGQAAEDALRRLRGVLLG